MAKNTISRTLRFYMDIHSTPMYIYTKLNVIQSKYKGGRMNYILFFKYKINFWQYRQKNWKMNIAKNIATQMRL